MLKVRQLKHQKCQGVGYGKMSFPLLSQLADLSHTGSGAKSEHVSTFNTFCTFHIHFSALGNHLGQGVSPHFF